MGGERGRSCSRPTTPRAGFQHQLVAAPVAQVGRIGHPDVGPGRADRAMDQSPIPVDPMRQQGRVLVLRRHDHAVALEAAEILRERQSHARTLTRVGGIDNGILAQFGNIGDARIFDAPQLFRKMLGIGQQGGLRIDPPAVPAVGGAGRAEMGLPAAILDAAQQQRRAVGQPRRAGIEHAVDRIGPIGGGQDGIVLVTGERARGGDCS